MALGNGSSWINSITAVSTTVAATLLVGFLGTFKDMAAQAPLITAHMQTTSAKLVEIESKQTDMSLLLAGMTKDYASQAMLRAEMDKVEARIRELQVQQAVLRQMLEPHRR